MEKKKILYLMHVSWGWIKQRPHFIAECLTEKYDVTVCCRKSYLHKLSNISSSKSKIELNILFVLPFNRYRLINLVNKFLVCKQLSRILKNTDIIWITHPDIYGELNCKIPDNAYVVYDCMDDALEFPSVLSNTKVYQQLVSDEKQLLMRSNLVFTTAHYLKFKLMQRYGDIDNIHVINNAVKIYDDTDSSELSSDILDIFSSKETKFILYVGTISVWFDFKLIMESVKLFENITYVLIGPTDVAIPQHERIIYHPPVEHEKIQKIMQMADALIMPFLTTDLIRSVNPVKVYEYISSAKPAIIIKYEETEKFASFVYLYSTYLEYFYFIQQLITSRLTSKSSLKDCLTYAHLNTWDTRSAEIIKLLDDY
jgi:glycosyltransferase involved in cell wall biosynthesis